MVYTYLLKSDIDGSFYVGISKDCRVRLKEHNRKGVVHTRDKAPWKLVYVKEHDNYIDARKHEKWLKKKNRIYKNELAGQAATRYLDELEKEGKIKQIGDQGRGVYYELINS